MRKNTPTVRNGILIDDAGASHDRAPIVVDSEDWFKWLESATRFAFEDAAGRYTARKRQRAGNAYWYAFKRRGSQLRDAYLGKSDALRLETLRAGVAKLETSGGREPVEPLPATEALARARPHALDWRGLGLLPTKLNTPRVNATQIVPTRALQRLESALEHPLTVVSAPPGYGKTTLLAHWIASSHLSAAWVSLDASDNDPAMLFTYMCAALDQVVPGLFEKMQPLLHVGHSEVPSTILTALIHELATAPSPTLLVLDDYHKITHDNAPIHEAMSFVVEHLPAQVHLVIASRSDPPLPLARLRARRNLLELRAADLALSSEESRVFLTDRMGLSLSAEQVAALYKRTEGWVGALHLAALSLQERPDLAGSLASALGESRYMVEYVVEEVLQPLPSDMRAFLLRVALLDRVAGPLCDAVTGSTKGQAMLAALERANLFLAPLDDQPRWYRFHGLFATMVRCYVRENQPEIVPQVYVRASAWCEANSHVGEAIGYAFAANDLGRAATLLESFAETALASGSIALLDEALSRLPDDIVRESPRLCVAQAYVLLMSRDRRAAYLEWVRHAETALEKSAHLLDRADRALLQGEILALRASVAHAQRHTRPQASIALFEAALGLLPDPHPLRNFATVYLGLNYILNGAVRAAGETLKGLLRASEASGDVLYAPISAAYLSLATLLRGRLDEALAYCHQAAHYMAETDIASLEAAVHLVMGTVLYERNELESAFDHLSRSLAMPFDLTLPLYIGYPALASVYYAQGNYAQARQTMEQSLIRWEQMQATGIDAYQWAGRLIQAQQARLWLIEGDVAAASDWVRQHARWIADDRALKQEPPAFLRELEDMVLVRAHLAEGRPDEALALLEQLAFSAWERDRIYRLIEVLVLQAEAYDTLGNTSLALDALGSALELAAPEYCIRTFVDGGPAVRQVFAQFLGEMARQAEPRAREMPRDYLAALAQALELTLPAISGAQWPTLPGAVGHVATGRRRETPPPVERLTPRETQVLALIETGHSNKDIARVLAPITVATVKHHVQSIFMKLDARSRTQAVARARALRLLPVEPGDLALETESRGQPLEGRGRALGSFSEFNPGTG